MSAAIATRFAAMLAATALATPSAWPAPVDKGATVRGPEPWRKLDLPAPLARLLETGRWDKTPIGFRIVALSFMADGCVAQARRDPSMHAAASACVARGLELAQATRPRALDIERANQGLWLSHFNLMLGAADSLGPCPDASLHAKIAHALARRTLHEPTFHVPSYATGYRWPADQSATLASLARYDCGHGADVAQQPLQRWRGYMLARAMDDALGLPWSEATGRARGARDPRGCALAWQTRFLQEVDATLAATWWRQFKVHYLVDRLAGVGFREWPPGRERAADIDSGPIVAGVGAAATALAIAAARVMDDGLLATRLQATAFLVGQTTRVSPRLARAANTALASAILYLGKYATPHRAVCGERAARSVEAGRGEQREAAHRMGDGL
jgi:hypothetical protein